MFTPHTFETPIGSPPPNAAPKPRAVTALSKPAPVPQSPGGHGAIHEQHWLQPGDELGYVCSDDDEGAW